MPDYMIPITCPSCGSRGPSDLGANRFVCAYCGREYILNNAGQASAPDQPVLRDLISAPKGVEMQEDFQCLRLTRRWFSWKYIPMALFCIFWDGFLIFWYGIAFSTGAPLIFVLFPLLHLAVGAGLTYSTLAGFINRTFLEITPDKLSIRHAPIPWIGNMTLNINEIRQLYSEEAAHRGEHGTTYTYELWMASQDGKSRKLLSGIDNSDIPLYLEQQSERWLQIVDQPVAGELA
jgi:hypothetical protein